VIEERRKDIEKAISLIEEAKSILESAAQEERDAFDELSESEQDTPKGITMDTAASTLEDTLETCESLISKLHDAKV